MTNGNLFIRKLDIVDENDTSIYRIRDVPAIKGLKDALKVVAHKDSQRSLVGILIKGVSFLDKDFKALFGMEDEDEKDK